MTSRFRALVATIAAFALCFGAYEVASASQRQRDSIPSTQSIRACTTDTGYLRLASHRRCSRGTKKVALARPATAPKALAVIATGGKGSQKSSLSLVAGTSLQASCTQPGGEPVALLTIAHSGPTRIDGTSYLVSSGNTSVGFDPTSGPEIFPPAGAGTVYETSGGTYDDQSGTGYGSLNLHVIITVRHAVFTVDAILEANEGSQVCRISAEVESATT